MGETFTLGETIATEYPVTPPGTYYAVVESVTTRDSRYLDDNGNKQKEVAFRFKIVDDRYPESDGNLVFGRTSNKFTNHENCKLRQWVLEIFGYNDVPLGFNFDTDDLVGQPVQVVISNNEGKDKEGNPRTYVNVDTLLRVNAYEDSSDAF